MTTTLLETLPASAQPRPRRSNPDEALTFATIGVAGYAGILLDCLEPLIQNGKASLIAATVRTRSKAPERCEQIESRGGRIFPDWKVMVDAIGSGLDCLIVPTGIQDHPKMAIYALEKGINVLLEKPIAATLGEAQAIHRAAERSEAGLIIGYQDLYTESTHAIKELLLGGALGTIQSVSVLCLWPREDDYFSRNSWAGRLRMGDDWVLDSPVNNAMGHFINLPLFWLGKSALSSASAVQVSGSLYRSRDLESFDTAAIRMTTEDGAAIDFHGSHASASINGPLIRIDGTEGSILWVADQHYILKTGEGEKTISMPTTTDARHQLLEKTVSWLLGEPLIASTAEQAMEQTRVVHLLHSGLSIHEVEPASIITEGGKRVLRNLDSIFQECFSEGRLLSQDDAPWAMPAETIDWTSVAHLSEPSP